MPAPKSPRKTSPDISIGESVEILSKALAGFDFHVDADDFILYELNRMIEEDRASFEDEEFRILIDEGIREHVEEILSVRAALAGRLRMTARSVDPATRTVAERVIRALENTGYDLRNAGVVVRTYTTYLFERLQSLDNTGTGEAAAREWIQSWKADEPPDLPAIADGKLIAELQAIGRPALGPTTELLLQSPEDRQCAEVALAVLCAVRSTISARVLAYVVSEPMLDEDLEARAYMAVRSMWPLGRPYILHSLHSHAHEDLPFRWFQLLMEVEETTTSELIYEEMRMHGSQANYLEDLWALTSLLVHSSDPEIEDKVLEWINNPHTPVPVIPMLEEFLKEYQRPEPKDGSNPWTQRAQLLALNAKYVAASQLFDAGNAEQAMIALDKILEARPGYPFAEMLKEINSRCTT